MRPNRFSHIYIYIYIYMYMNTVLFVNAPLGFSENLFLVIIIIIIIINTFINKTHLLQ